MVFNPPSEKLVPNEKLANGKLLTTESYFSFVNIMYRAIGNSSITSVYVEVNVISPQLYKVINID